MGVLQPAVLSLQQTLDALRVDKWKASKDLKAATTANVESIRRDLEGALPGLTTAADASPASLPAALALSRNVGALYDVAVRVTVIAESTAPGDQADALGRSLSGLESARRTLADRMQQMAAAQDAKVADLQKQLNTRPAVAPVCPPVVAATPPRKTPAKRKKTVKPTSPGAP